MVDGLSAGHSEMPTPPLGPEHRRNQRTTLSTPLPGSAVFGGARAFSHDTLARHTRGPTLSLGMLQFAAGLLAIAPRKSPADRQAVLGWNPSCRPANLRLQDITPTGRLRSPPLHGGSKGSSDSVVSIHDSPKSPPPVLAGAPNPWRDAAAGICLADFSKLGKQHVGHRSTSSMPGSVLSAKRGRDGPPAVCPPPARRRCELKLLTCQPRPANSCPPLEHSHCSRPPDCTLAGRLGGFIVADAPSEPARERPCQSE